MAIVRIIVLLLSLFFTTLGYLLGSCGVKVSCPLHASLAPYSFTVFEPLFLYSLCTIPLALTLLFVKDTGVQRWLSFARWYVPSSVLLLILVPLHNGSSLPLYSVSKEGVALALGIVFLCGSLFVMSRTGPERAT